MNRIALITGAFGQVGVDLIEKLIGYNELILLSHEKGPTSVLPLNCCVVKGKYIIVYTIIICNIYNICTMYNIQYIIYNICVQMSQCVQCNMYNIYYINMYYIWKCLIVLFLKKGMYWIFHLCNH